MCAFACVSFQHNNRPFHLLSCANDRNIEEKERWLLRFASPQKPAQIFKSPHTKTETPDATVSKNQLPRTNRNSTGKIRSFRFDRECRLP
jgi:hypothetical protein